MKETILLVEDEIELQQNLKEILEHHGFYVLAAENGIDALIKSNHHEINLILSDVSMPKMDGFQFLRILRNDERFLHTPFIFLSAKGSAEDKSEGLDEGAVVYLTKPISSSLLLEAIFGALKKKES